MKKLKDLKQFMEENIIHMNYMGLCVVVIISMVVGFFLYGLALDGLTALVGMVIVLGCNLLKIAVNVSIVSMSSKAIACWILVAVVFGITKYMENRIEISAK